MEKKPKLNARATYTALSMENNREIWRDGNREWHAHGDALSQGSSTPDEPVRERRDGGTVPRRRKNSKRLRYHTTTRAKLEPRADIPAKGNRKRTMWRYTGTRGRNRENGRDTGRAST